MALTFVPIVAHVCQPDPVPPPVATPAATPAPNPGDPDYSIMDALFDFALGKKGTLMLVSKKSGEAYTVLDYNQETQQATLKGPYGGRFRPVVGDREAKQYDPVWR